MSDLPVDVVLLGDSRELLKTLPDCSVDSVVTDPPAGISFMGKDWDDPDALHDGEHKDRDAFVAFLTGIMAECLRVLKPGGHALVWSLPRTSHWTAMAIEDAGFEIRDCIHHIFGQGFPKSLNVGKAIDKMAGAERKVVGVKPGQEAFAGRGSSSVDSFKNQTMGQEGGFARPWMNDPEKVDRYHMQTAPATEDAKKWEGWGTALKPAVETWWLARKPIEAKSVVAQVLATGTGAMNIDGTRVGADSADSRGTQRVNRGGGENTEQWRMGGAVGAGAVSGSPSGRYPSNLVLSHLHTCRQVGTKTVDAPVINRFTDGMKPFGEGAGHPYESSGGGTEEQPVYECDPECMVRKLDEQSGLLKSGEVKPHHMRNNSKHESNGGYEGGLGDTPLMGYGDQGGASRFFAVFEPTYDVPFIYTGKASKADKNADLQNMPARAQHEMSEQTVSTQSNRRCRTCGRVKFGQPHCECETPDWEETAGSKSGNFHPTVKSQPLMTYLVRLVTPKGGIVLDPFAGSGSTCVAAATEGMHFIGIEREAEYHVIATTRTDAALGRAREAQGTKDLFDLAMSMDED